MVTGNKSGKRMFFPGRGKVGNFVDGQGNLERSQGIWLINGYGNVKKNTCSVYWGKDVPRKNFMLS